MAVVRRLVAVVEVFGTAFNIRFGHLAQRCYYRFGLDYRGASAPNTAPIMVPSRSAGHGPHDTTFGEHGWWSACSVQASLDGRRGLNSFRRPGRLHTMFVERTRLCAIPRHTQCLFPSSTIASVSTSPTVSTYVPLVKSIVSCLVATSDGTIDVLPSQCCSTSIQSLSNDNDPSTTLETTHGDFLLSGSTYDGGYLAQGPILGLGSSTPPPIPTGNTHNMVTRSKAGIVKPKALTVEVLDYGPRTVKEAFADPEWKCTVQVEFDALMANSTWELVSLPHGRKVIRSKWLFKLKKNLDGTIAQRKARLVAKGCSQVLGCDFKEMFSPVVKPVTIRTMLTVAVSCGWQLHQVDVNNSFLNGDLTDKVFMQQPPDYV
ncbi:hypothetical protein J1N35_007802 [Gossypium stocksii]|uniref:Reverse transcriptase Ty1/copia-type domain-containing protein n=1 Tax=Gossypium stocksii TaxID=47602 RepID=A0A9D3W726_9ROSI|nr:hypothetical protein J1N35_007802 [Gossypium stocksii]